MNILNRKPMYNIEGISIKLLQSILTGKSSIATITEKIYNSIFLSNGKTIKCINKYYKTNDNKQFKTCSTVSHCAKCQNFFNISSNGAFNCIDCHILMIDKFKNNEIKMK